MELTFEHANVLWLLLALPVMVLGHLISLAHLHRSAILFANFAALQRVTGRRIFSRQLPLLTLRMLALLCLILAAAGVTLWFTGKSSLADYVVAIDTSASMTAEDFKPSRLEAAKTAAANFVSAFKSQGRVGLVSFSGSAFIELLPTENSRDAIDAVRALDIVKEGGTDIPGALITGTNLLLPSAKGRAIILITDGASTVGEFLEDSVTKAAEYAADHQVQVHTIGIGSRSGSIGFLPEYYGVNATYQEDTLTLISNITDGTFYPVPLDDPSALDAAYAELAGKSEEATIPRPLTGGLLLAAISLLVLEWGLSSTRFRRVP